MKTDIVTDTAVPAAICIFPSTPQLYDPMHLAEEAGLLDVVVVVVAKFGFLALTAGAAGDALGSRKLGASTGGPWSCCR